MTPFASATPAGKASIIAAVAFLLVVLWAMLTMVGTLAGIGRLGPDVDFAAVPGWLWTYRAHPQVQLWFKVAGLASGAFILAIGVLAAFKVRRPLHGAARWASEGEIARVGLRGKSGMVLGGWGSG